MARTFGCKTYASLASLKYVGHPPEYRPCPQTPQAAGAALSSAGLCWQSVGGPGARPRGQAKEVSGRERTCSPTSPLGLAVHNRERVEEGSGPRTNSSLGLHGPGHGRERASGATQQVEFTLPVH